MIHRNLFFNLLLIIFCFITPCLSAGMMMPNMEDFEKELAEANRAIEEYVASLPPAEQEAFNREVENMSRMFENMSEDEFEKFLGEMFADEPMMMESNPFDEAIQQTAQEEIEVVLSAQDKKKAETALAIIDDIIRQSNLFIVTVNSSSDLPERINQWTKKDKIAHWQKEADWATFKLELESFIQKLYRAEEQDLTTKKYKYLLELIADEALYNNLIQLRTELKNNIPQIEIPEFSIQRLSAETKKIIQQILEKYTEGFYLLDIPKALDTLFEKYAPEEEKIRAGEEAATKRAQEAARMTRTPASSSEAGSEAMDYGYGDYYGGGYDNYYGGYDNYGGGYDNYSPYGGYDNYGGGSSNYGSGSGSGSSRGGSSGGSGGSGRLSGTNQEADEETKEDKKDKNKKTKAEKFTPHFELDTALRDIKKDLEEIKLAMTETEENPTKLADLNKFVEHITQNEEKMDETLAGYILPRVIDKKFSDIALALKKIDSKDLNQDDLAHYQKEVKKLFDEHKKQLDNLVKTINSFERKTEEEKEEAKKAPAKLAGTEEPTKFDVEKLPATKQWAYFGGDENLLTNDEDKKLTETITPVSLFAIRDKVIKLFKTVQEFENKKAKAPKKPKPVSSEIPTL